jgi:hypothetical protein
MHFDLLDAYLLTGSPSKPEVVATLLAGPSPVPTAAAFYEGMRMLGSRTPDLTLVALRLVLAGKRADDASVVELREYVQRARGGGDGAQEAREAYARVLSGGE